MLYKMKKNLDNRLVDELGSEVNEDTRWDYHEVEEDAANFDMDADEFIEKYLEECGYWYGVQETKDDEWGWGSYSYDEAVRLLKEQGYGLIAVIDEDKKDAVCVEEIYYEEVI